MTAPATVEREARIVYLVRHAESEYNAVSSAGLTYTGKDRVGDTHLSEKGVKQAEAFAKKHSEAKFARLYHTGLHRTRETLAPIVETRNLDVAPVVELPELQECQWGALEGKVVDFNATMAAWKAGKTPEGGESYDVFQTRIKAGVAKILEGPFPALVIAHGGTIKCLFDMLGKPCKRNVKNTTMVECLADDLERLVQPAVQPVLSMIETNSAKP